MRDLSSSARDVPAAFGLPCPSRPRVPPWSRWTLATLLAAGLASGLAIGAITISSGAAELAVGQHAGGTGLTWWSATGVVVTAATPASPPASLSQSAASPTVLPSSGASYMANSGAGGNNAVEFQFQETTGAPGNTEVEIQFSVTVNGASQTSTVYLETQASAPATPLSFNLYFDGGSNTATLNPEQELSGSCSAVGQCP